MALTKPQVIHVLFIITLIGLFALPLIIGDSSNCDIPSWRCIFDISKLNGDYDLGTLTLKGLYLDKFLVWEIVALFQASIFSILLAIEAPASKVGKWFAWIYGLIIIFAVLGALLIIFKAITVYQLLVVVIVFIFLFGDIYMWKKNNEQIYKLLIFYVDIPIIISLLLITVVVSVPMQKDYHQFFSGSVAFQLLMGNLLIFILRSHQEIESKNMTVRQTIRTLHKPSPDLNE